MTVALLVVLGFALFFSAFIAGVWLQATENRDRDRRLVRFVQNRGNVPFDSAAKIMADFTHEEVWRWRRAHLCANEEE